MNLVSATYARNNLSRLLDEVVKKDKRFILLRDSQPQAVIIPYDELLEIESKWQEEFQQLAKKTRPFFRKWLKSQKIKSKSLTEERLYELVNEVAGRS